MNEFIMKRKDNYWWEKTLVSIGKPLILFLVKTPITPNMITIFNLIVVFPIVCLTSFNQNYIALAIMIQIYAFFDVLDGNLARNKNMKSELGRKLDIFADTLFYTIGYFFIGIWMCEVEVWFVVFAIMVQQIYGWIATYYIVPQIRKLENFKHTPTKQFFINKGIIFGMDATLECFFASVLLLFPFRKAIFIICPCLWIMDMVYRLYELEKYN